MVSFPGNGCAFTPLLSLALAITSPLASISFVVGPGVSTCTKGCGSIQNQSPIATSSTSCEALPFPRPTPIFVNTNSLNGRKQYHSSIQNSEEFQTSRRTSSPLRVLSTDISSDVPENAIPPIDPATQSKVEREFYTMMRQFSNFTPRDIAAVANYRYRALFEGVAAATTEPLVIKAFTIVFEDLLPVRVAGRIIFGRLGQVMEASIEKRDYLDQKLKNVAGFTTDQIDEGRRAFSILDVDGEGELTIEQLVDSGIVETVAELLEYKSFDDFVEKLESDDKGRMNFETFMVGLQRCADDGCHYNCNLNEVFTEIVKMMEPIQEQKRKTSVSERKKRASAKYDSMVTAFGEWEDLVPEGDGRMIEVLRGCFAGAKNEKVLNALKIVYTDYSAIRIAGDLVFKLMRRLVGAKK